MGKGVFLVWCFAGEFVVDCAFIVDRRHPVAWRLKTVTTLRFIFRSVVEKRRIGSLWESCTKVLNSIQFV